jgi:hypothetical protein
MVVPIPDERAEECAKDLASDVREVGKKLLPLIEARDRGDNLSKGEVEDIAMYKAQIRDLSELICRCMVTGKEYSVGDYVTKRSFLLSKISKAMVDAGYKRLKNQLIH